MGKINEATTGIRNTIRWGMSGFPGIQKQKNRKLARRGLNPLIVADLKVQTKAFTRFVKHGGAAPKVRVVALPGLTTRVGNVPSFVGIGLDEHVATRTHKVRLNWQNLHANAVKRKKRLKEITGARSRTADLVWPTGNPLDPIAGHTPGIKRRLVNGTAGAITTGHGTRDTTRSSAVNKTLSDVNSPNVSRDTVVMSNLATIKYMTSPSTELNSIKGAVANLPTPRYSALTGANDLRVGGHFDDLVAHVQEERERKKWETASVMTTDDRLSKLVPHTINSYLRTYGNDPSKAREAFRYDAHNAWFKPNINTSPQSDTEDLTAHSLHTLATTPPLVGRRRALSDARLPPPVKPINSRGD